MGSFLWVIFAPSVAEVDVVVLLLDFLVELVESDEFFNGLFFGEDADVFDGFTTLEVPSTFFGTSVSVPDAMDCDDCGI